MGPEIPQNAVVVEASEPLEQRLKLHPLGPGQYYYFAEEYCDSDFLEVPGNFKLDIQQMDINVRKGKPILDVGTYSSQKGLSGFFADLNHEFEISLMNNLPNSESLGIVRNDGQTNQNSQDSGKAT